jgi:hypothetical protein
VVWVLIAQSFRVDDAWHPLVHRGKIVKQNLKKGVLWMSALENYGMY